LSITVERTMFGGTSKFVLLSVQEDV
jgi:hypothetical protein